MELITENGNQRHTILEGTRMDEMPEPLEAMNKTTSKTMFSLSTCLIKLVKTRRELLTRLVKFPIKFRAAIRNRW